MKQLIFSLICLALSAVFIDAQTPQPIQPGFTVERELGQAAKHNYELSLKKGELLNFVVEQRGVDVVLRIYTGDGKFHDRVDSPNGTQGDEPYRMVATGDGRFRIEISRWDENMPAGKYLVKTVEVRPANEAELKAEKLRQELLEIITADNRFDSYPDSLKRYYLNNALITNAFGSIFNAAEAIEASAKNPARLPEKASSEVELSGVKMEDFGDLVVMSVERSRHYKSPSENIDRLNFSRLGYIFKRIGKEWRIASVQGTYNGREPRPFKLEIKQLDAFVGVYGTGNPAETLTITREDNRLVGQFPAGEKFTLIPESENTVYGGGVGVAFVRDPNGAVNQIVVHYPMPEDRIVMQNKVK
jgi:hypothetical protein